MCFNPHTHVECDHNTLQCHPTPKSFNPHTHVECDGSQTPRAYQTTSFNPHTHVECDVIKRAGLVVE